ncbi:MAG: Tab2 family RNA-binding protein, partial [Cyanobacteria bacterium P01_A01_bin.137]
LAQWLDSVRPVFAQSLPGSPDGLILEAGLADRWVLATFDDADVRGAAQAFEQRKQVAKGLHFLLIRPDDSGMTYTGLWLLQDGPNQQVE